MSIITLNFLNFDYLSCYWSLGKRMIQLDLIVWVNHVISHNKHVWKSTHHIDGPFLDQLVDYRLNGKNRNQMVMLLIIRSTFDPIGLFVPIEKRIFVNNVISHIKHMRNSHHCIVGPFLDQPVDCRQKWQNLE